MMKSFDAISDLPHTREKRASVNRRTAFTLAIGGATGLASQSNRAHAESVPPTQLQNLKAVGAEHRVVTIQHRSKTFVVLTADGRSAVFPEINLRFKIDTSGDGPKADSPVILPGGMRGDRATVFLASPMELAPLIERVT